ncbi:MAG: hypothetical protein RQ801_08960 [Spirochaetaceae bacterium]|nr:hypothetical protein [Spirochaetaceae bacterium]
MGRVITRTSACIDATITSLGMESIINRMLDELSGDIPAESEFLGYGFAVPGLIDKQAKVWKMVSRYPRLRNFSFNHIRGAKGGVIVIERNIDSLLRYCLQQNPSLAAGTTLLLHWGYGIAISLASNGEIMHAPNGLFGEIGLWNVRMTASHPKRTLEATASLRTVLQSIGIAEDEDEPIVARKVRRGEIHRDALEKVHSAITAVIRNLYVTFFPVSILILSPFVDSEEALRLEKNLIAKPPVFANPLPGITALDYDEVGEAVGVANEVYSEALKEYLTASW